MTEWVTSPSRAPEKTRPFTRTQLKSLEGHWIGGSTKRWLLRQWKLAMSAGMSCGMTRTLTSLKIDGPWNHNRVVIMKLLNKLIKIEVKQKWPRRKRWNSASHERAQRRSPAISAGCSYRLE